MASREEAEVVPATEAISSRTTAATTRMVARITILLDRLILSIAPVEAAISEVEVTTIADTPVEATVTMITIGTEVVGLDTSSATAETNLQSVLLRCQTRPMVPFRDSN